ncbi:MAG: hypothetical protein FD173_1448 [Gallionellaceae bacterium]|nr:MAG: hypothetical protein FD173_1448 [Gallionellaceae bacterium]
MKYPFLFMLISVLLGMLVFMMLASAVWAELKACVDKKGDSRH